MKIAFPKPKANTTAVKPREYKEDEIVLNGIMTTDARKAALINNKIYEVAEG